MCSGRPSAVLHSSSAGCIGPPLFGGRPCLCLPFANPKAAVCQSSDYQFKLFSVEIFILNSNFPSFTMIFVIASGYSFRVISHHEVSLLLRDAYFRSIRSTCLRCFAVEGKRTEADGGGESKDSRICTRTAATGGRKDGFQARKGRCHVCSAAKGITLKSLKRTFLGAFRVFGSVSLYLW